MADVVQCRVAACVLVLLYVNRRRRNRKRWQNRRFGRNLISVEIPPLERTTRSFKIFAHFYPSFSASSSIFVPQIWTVLNFLDELKSCTFVFTSVRHFVKCRANHVDRARVLIGWQSPTHIYQPFTPLFTRQIRVYKKVGEKVGENRGKLYLSPTVYQLVCRLFLCRSHTPTWVCQHEFANFSLPCEGRFTVTSNLKQYLHHLVVSITAKRVPIRYCQSKTLSLRSNSKPFSDLLDK